MAQLVHQVQHLLLAAHVQGGGRLVQHQQGRLLGQGPGQDGPLALAPRQGAHGPVGQGGQVQAVEHRAGHGQVGRALQAEGPDVGRAAQQHVVDHPHPRGDDRVLGHHGQPAGPLPVGERGGAAPVQGDGAAEPGPPGHGPDQGGLAGAVGAHQRDPGPGGHGQRHLAHHVPPAQAHRHVATGQARRSDGASRAGHVGTRRRVRSTTAKKGAPTRAVTTPMGTSAGARAVRASRSARVRKAPPSSRDTGRMTR